MTTDEAFDKMINTRGIFHVLELPKGTVGSLRNDIKTARAGVSLEKKIALLKKAGYQVVQEMEWKKE